VSVAPVYWAWGAGYRGKDRYYRIYCGDIATQFRIKRKGRRWVIIDDDGPNAQFDDKTYKTITVAVQAMSERATT